MLITVIKRKEEANRYLRVKVGGGNISISDD